MESTGVYWKPIYHLLEDRFVLLLVNAQHIKRVPGRKADVKDAQWIAQLLQHGLLSPSFVPPPPIRELRDLTRQRTQSIRERARVINRIQKILEDANIKLSSVATDVMGATGKAILAAMVRGVEDPIFLADQARGSLRRKKPQLQTALEGKVTAHHRFLLESLLSEIRFHEEMIARYMTRIEETTAPFEKEAARLMTIPGMGRQAAEVLTAEIGADMSRFPTAGHLSSWAGMCPSNDESAGKRRSARTTKGSRWLRTTLVQVAWSAIRTKETIFVLLYKKWARRLGKKKGVDRGGAQDFGDRLQLAEDGKRLCGEIRA